MIDDDFILFWTQYKYGHQPLSIIQAEAREEYNG